MSEYAEIPETFNGRLNFHYKKYKVWPATTSLFAGFIIFIDLIFLVFDFSFNMLLVFSFHLLFTCLVNYIGSGIYLIRTENDVINIENIWRKKMSPLSDVKDIDLISICFAISP